MNLFLPTTDINVPALATVQSRVNHPVLSVTVFTSPYPEYTDKNGKYIPDRVEVLLKQFYFPGTITSINDNGTFNVLFDDGNVKNGVVVENIKGAISIDLNKFSIKLA